jgi:arylsulfatase A-like enzyme
VIFRNAFTPNPVCSPGRACFWTGKIPSAHGVHDHIDELGTARDFPGIQGQETLALRLKQAGYYTGLSGKWHCGQPWKKPDGFDVWFTSAMGTNSQFGPQEFFEGGTGETVKGNGHQAVYYTDRALRFLREKPADAPFFLYVGYTDTHGPFSGEPPRLVSRYLKNATFSDIPDEPYAPVHGKPIGAPTKERANDRMALAQYYASVTAMDEQVGRILDELENRGELDNTIIVYTSDHGHMNWHHRLFGKGNATVPQNFLEESIRVPMIIRAPGHIPAGTDRTERIDHCDLHATLLDAAGIANGDPRKPGRSAWTALRNGAMPDGWRTAQFCELGNARMMLQGGLKLIVRYPGPNGHFADELYDMNADPRETENRIGQLAYTAQVASMRAALDEYFAKYELPERSGREIARQPRCNPKENWYFQTK